MTGAQGIATALAERGWAVAREFLPPPVIAELARDARQRLRDGEFRPAGVGSGPQHLVRGDVRGDAILWLDAGGSRAQREAFDAFEALRVALNRELQLGLFDFECHYACYSPGSRYRRHLDQLAGDDRRTLSTILYLNSAWHADDGGQLRLYLPQGPVEVLPQAGTLAAFLSARFEHEVLPAARERLSLTGWFCRRA